MDRTPRATLLRNGHILARVDSPPVEALLAVDGRVVFVGEDEGVREAARALSRVGRRVEEVDLGGGWAVSGLQDGHGHLGLLARTHGTVNLRGCKNSGEMTERVVERAADTPSGDWVRGQGWDETGWEGSSVSDLHHRELSRAVPAHPVLLTRVDEHAALLNRAALLRCGIDADAPGQDPLAFAPGGRVEVDGAGRPTGVLLDGALERVSAEIPEDDSATREKNLLLAQEEILSYGVTAVHDMAVNVDELDRLRGLVVAGAWRLGVNVWLSGEESQDPVFLEDIAARAYGPRLGERAEVVLVLGVKVFADGALGSRGAALLEPYADAPAESGLLMHETAEIERRVRLAVAAGFTPAIHAIGDRANRQALDLYEELGRSLPALAPLRPRIEHAQIVDPTDMPRFFQLGITAAVQPAFGLSDAPWVEKRLGAGRLPAAYAWSRLAPDPSFLCLGTDFPIEGPDPLRNLFAARTCAAPESRVLTAREALAAHTSGVARAARQETWRGQLAPGYDADVTVLDGNPLGPAQALQTLRVTHTIVRGDVVYRAAGRSA
jgi:predicted amidohydrolase YtcJ